MGTNPVVEAVQSAQKTAKKSRVSSVLWTLLAFLFLLIGFIVSSSLAGAISENRWWMLASGLCSALILPAIIASWIRGIRRSRGRKRHAAAGPPTEAKPPGPVQPSSITSILVMNLLLVLGCSLLAAGTTKREVRRHGSWWVERIVHAAGGDTENPVLRNTERTLYWITSLLPGPDEPSAHASLSGQGDSGPSDGGISPETGAVYPDLSALDGAITTGGEIRVAYQKQGPSIIVPVTLHGPNGVARVRMLFDTGATLCTVDSVTLRKLGVVLDLEDPTIKSYTANGMVRRKITVVDGLSIQGARVSGVTVTHCDPCATREVVGLLGLNVLRHFKVTLDDEASQIVLQPKASRTGHLLDIRPFVKLGAARGRWRGPMLSIQLTVHNRSGRGMRYLKLVAEVKDEQGKTGRIWGEIRNVPPRSKVPMKIEGLSPVKGGRFSLKLERADW
jgi:hypothetical protein